MPKFIAQAESTECALACLAMISHSLGRPVSLPTLRALCHGSSRGVTLKAVKDTAKQIGLNATAVRCSVDELDKLTLPAILYWNNNHFVVLHKCGSKHASILDPAIGIRKIDRSQIAQHFSSVAMNFTVAADADKIVDRQPGWREMIDRVKLPTRPLFVVLALGLLLEFLALSAPIFMQIMIDRAIQWSNSSIILPVAAFFLVLFVCQAGLHYVRYECSERIARILAGRFSASVGHSVFHRSLAYFLSRSPADLLTKFRSIRALVDTLIRGMTSLAIDITVAGVSGVAMIMFSPTLALWAFVLLAVSATIRLSTIARETQLNQADVTASTSETGVIFQNLKAIEPIKAQGMERRMLAKWQSELDRALDADHRRKLFQVFLQTYDSLSNSIENLVVITIGAMLVIEAELSLGMLLAFFAYRLYVRERVLAIVRSCSEILAARVHVDRVFDLIDDTAIESAETSAQHKLEGHVRLRNVAFKYGAADDWILRDVNLDISPGESVAIVGISGAGKSTLLRVLLGLVAPNHGTVKLDDADPADFSVGEMRDQIGVALQEDEIFGGTIAENIACFDQPLDSARVKSAAASAQFLSTVQGMPMGFETLITEGGHALSSGQKQRLILARLFYKAPKLIILDEGTANLDGETEASVLAALFELPATKIITAHNPNTLKFVDKVLELRDGRLVMRHR